MAKRLLLLFVVLIFTNLLYSQDISGTWEGNYSRQLLVPTPQKLIVEISLYNDSLITGATHLIYKNNKYEHYKISGVFHAKDSTIQFTEDSVIAVNSARWQIIA